MKHFIAIHRFHNDEKRKEYFSNTVLIIDEAHSIKTDKSNKDFKKV